VEKPGFWWKSPPDRGPIPLTHLPHIGVLGNAPLDMVMLTGKTFPGKVTRHKEPRVVRRLVHNRPGICRSQEGAHVGD
jgi:hypothetical protein